MSNTSIDRRGFIQVSGITALAALQTIQTQAAENHPNILWITTEDLSLHLGCYGDETAHTPNLDRFAEKSIRYTHAFATAPLCTPARSSIITGVYASSMGTQHLRGVVPLSKQIECFTNELRRQGYYCSNNVKEDYNFPTPDDAWDESSAKAHWRGKKDGQPFFSVFNFMTTHQSRTRYGKEDLDKANQTLSPNERIDPDTIPIPPYYPDTPTVRINLAALYTQVTIMDKEFQQIIDQLQEDGLDEDTVVFFYSDHGTGLPRGKRWLLDSGLQVPFMVHFPKKYEHLAPQAMGTFNDELITFADLAPSIHSLVGLKPKEYMQGHAFLGEHKEQPQEYIFAIRDRVDEVLMLSRSVRDHRYQYIRNFMPHRARMQRSFFSELTPIRQEIRRLHEEGKLVGHETWLMQKNIPVDELYDTSTDPYELHNLADDPNFKDILIKLKTELFRWIKETNDLGFVPEYEMLRRADGGSPYDTFQEDYDLNGLLTLADKVGRGAQYLDDFIDALQSDDPSVRYWGATGIAALGDEGKPALGVISGVYMADPSPCVRIAAAETVCRIDDSGMAVMKLADELLSDDDVVKLHASQILMVIGDKANPAVPQMKMVQAQLSRDVARQWYTLENIEFMLRTFGEI
jgi:uncharacterized sulfatase